MLPQFAAAAQIIRVARAFKDRTSHFVPKCGRIETPAGTVECELHSDGSVTVHNLPAHRAFELVGVEVPGHGRVVVDAAWGSNWFFPVSDHGQELQATNIDRLTDY